MWYIFYHTHKKCFIPARSGNDEGGNGGVEGIWIDDADGPLRLCSL